MFKFAKCYAIVACMFVMLGVSEAYAQADRPVAFVHGISSDSGTWKSSAPYLANKFKISPRRPSFLDRGHHFYGDQANQLIGFLGADTTNVIAIAHSNGGIVSRVARQKGMNFASITTMGTPHHGAPIIGSTADGTATVFVSQFTNALGAPLLSLHLSWWNPLRWLATILKILSGMWGAIVLQSLQLLVNLQWDVTQEMPPSSLFHQIHAPTSGWNDINGSSEASIPVKVSLVITAPHARDGIFFSGTAPTQRSNGMKARSALIGTYKVMAEYFEGTSSNGSYSGFNERALKAQQFRQGMRALQEMDGRWCGLIGASVANRVLTSPQACSPSDGIVPVWSQYWDGAENVLSSALGHSAETSNPNLADLAGLRGLETAGVVRR